MKLKVVCFSCWLSLWSGLALAGELFLSGRLEQGGLVRVEVEPGSQVWLDGEALDVAPDGMVWFGLARDAGPHISLKVRGADGLELIHGLEIAPRVWPVQKISGLVEKYVSPPPEQLARIAGDNQKLEAARARRTLQPYMLSGFSQPADGPQSGEFGSQRILNGIAKSPHAGVDIAAPAGADVRAAADGVVSLVEQDMFYTGQTVMIDHGYGLSSVYAHMGSIKVKPGQSVHRGELIGTVGATGRALGPHLHWGVSWRGVRLDPGAVLAVAPVAKSEPGQ